MAAKDPRTRALVASIGGNTRAAKYDGAAVTANARAAFLAKFEDEVDPDKVLAPAERLRRAEAARRAYFARLALKSAQARKKAS